MTDSQIPTPEAGDTSGDKSPSFSPSARESASKRCKRTVARGADTLTPGDEVPSQTLAFASCAPVTADVTESPKDGAEPDRPVEDSMPRWLRRWIDQGLPRAAEVFVPPLNGHFVPRILREAGMVVAPPVTRASGSHLDPVGQHELDDDAKIPEFLRRQGVGAAHAQPIPSDREASESSQADQPSRFVPRILRTPPVTPSQAAPVAASVTPVVTTGSICPTCNCRVPARLSAAERQRAYRARKREQGKSNEGEGDNGV